MARITTSLVIMLVLANSSVTIMETSGLSNDIGVELAPGISERADSIITSMRGGFSPSTSVIESFVSFAVAGGQLFLLLVEATYAVPTMFENMGFPSGIVVGFFAPVYIIATIEMMLLILGRRSV